MDPPNCTYQKYKVAGNIVKIKISEIVDAEHGEYRMYRIAMTCCKEGITLQHVRVRLKKWVRCEGCRKPYKQGYCIHDPNSPNSYDTVFLCKRCSESIRAKSLRKEGNLFCFETSTHTPVPLLWSSSVATLHAIELLGTDHKHIRLHKISYKSIDQFLKDPRQTSLLNNLCIFQGCQFCARNKLYYSNASHLHNNNYCHNGVCDQCHKFRDRLLADRVHIFVYNGCGFPREITELIISLMIERHNSFKIVHEIEGSKNENTNRIYAIIDASHQNGKGYI